MLTRSKLKLESKIGLTLDGVEVITGDMTDPDVVNRVVTDIDIVVCCLGTMGGSKNLIVEKSVIALLEAP